MKSNKKTSNNGNSNIEKYGNESGLSNSTGIAKITKEFLMRKGIKNDITKKKFLKVGPKTYIFAKNKKQCQHNLSMLKKEQIV